MLRRRRFTRLPSPHEDLEQDRLAKQRFLQRSNQDPFERAHTLERIRAESARPTFYSLAEHFYSPTDVSCSALRISSRWSHVESHTDLGATACAGPVRATLLFPPCAARTEVGVHSSAMPKRELEAAFGAVAC